MRAKTDGRGEWTRVLTAAAFVATAMTVGLTLPGPVAGGGPDPCEALTKNHPACCVCGWDPQKDPSAWCRGWAFAGEMECSTLPVFDCLTEQDCRLT